MEKAKEYTSEEQLWLTENRLSKFQNRITPSWIRDMGENDSLFVAINVIISSFNKTATSIFLHEIEFKFRRAENFFIIL